MIRAVYLDAAQSVINVIDDAAGSVVVIEIGNPLWSHIRDSMVIEDYATPPPPPVPTIEEIRAALPPLTRRQVFIGLMQSGAVTEAEAIEASGGGAIPSKIDGVIGQLSATQRGPARITFRAFQIAYRLDPMVALLGAAAGMTDTDLDDFWTASAAI